MNTPGAETSADESQPRRRILVTGGCGFIGHAVAAELADNGHEVIAADIAEPAQPRRDIEYAHIDITRPEPLLEIAAGIDSIVHTASLVSTRRNDGDVIWHHNHGGTLNALAACEHHGIARLVHVSSASVVFSGHDIEDGDERLPYASVAQAPYAASKIAAEHRLESGSPLNGQAYFITNGEPLAFYAFVESLLTGLGYAPPTGRLPYWVACGGAAVLEAVGAVKGSNHGEERVSRFAVKYLATSKDFRIDKARRDLGWVPSVTLADGIEQTVAHLAQQSGA